MILRNKVSYRCLIVMGIVVFLMVPTCLQTKPVHTGKRLLADPWTFWKYSDLIKLDPWGDVTEQDNDILAVYYKKEGTDFYFRTDIMDFQEGSQSDIVLCIDIGEGGNSKLESGNSSLSSDIEWDLLIWISDLTDISIFDTSYSEQSAFLIDSTIDLKLDYVAIGLAQEPFIGVDTSAIQIQTFTVNKNHDTILDKSKPATPADTAGRAKLVIYFGNGFIGYGPHAISWYDGFAMQPFERLGERRGFKYLLDAVEKYSLPLTLNDLRIEQFPSNEYLLINDRLIELYNLGLLDPLMTLTYGHFMCWQPDDVDTKAIEIAEDLRENLDLPIPEVFHPYEGMLTAGDVEVIKNAGYKAIYGLDQYRYWTGWIDDWFDPVTLKEDIESLRKIHKINDIPFFFDTRLGNYQGFVTDSRWEIIDWNTYSEYEQYEGTDEGLDIWWRRILHDMAMDEDQEQYMTIGTDLLLVPWSFPDVADWNMGWLANHPWIEVTSFSDLLNRNWEMIDDGDLGIPDDNLLIRYSLEGDGHYNAYFSQFYYGGISDGHSSLIPAGVEIESYFDYVPYLRDNTLIPSGRKMGDDQTEGSIIYETLQNLRSAPDNDLTLLGWLSYFINTGEQTFHTNQYLDPTAQLKANYVGQVNKIMAAAEWADGLSQGTLEKSLQVFNEDLDLDGEDEYVMQNDKIFCIFENDGGRLEYGFGWSQERGGVELIAPLSQYFLMDVGWGWDQTDGEIATCPTWNRAPDGGFVQSNGTTWDYDYSLFDVTVGSDHLTFVSQDGHLTKKFTLSDENTITGHYRLTDITGIELGFGLVVNHRNMFEKDWSENIESLENPNYVGWKISEGGLGLVDYGEIILAATNSFLDSPARDEMKERGVGEEQYNDGHHLYYPYHCISLNGAGEFDVHLTLSSDLTTSVAAEAISMDSDYHLFQNFPNPFNCETKICFEIKTKSQSCVKIYNQKGQCIQTILDQYLPAGEHTVSWDGRDDGGYPVSSGIYLCTIRAGEDIKSLKLMLIR